MFADEILIEIDATLDSLIRNAEALQNADISDLSDIAIDAFQKTQESLLYHLLHMDEKFKTKRKNIQIPDKRSASYKIQEKLKKFEKLKGEVSVNIEQAAKKYPILSKRRGKRFLQKCQSSRD